MEFVIGGKRVFAGGGRGFDSGLPIILLLHAVARRRHGPYRLGVPGALVRPSWPYGACPRSARPRAERRAGAGRHRGAGRLTAFLDSRGIGRFGLAGHSMGALVALEAAAQAGARVEALALLGFAPSMRVHPDLLAAARAGAHAAIDMMVDWGFGRIGRGGGNPAPGLWLAGGATRLLERASGLTLASDLAACNAYEGAATAAARVECPTLLPSGGEDRMTPPAAASAFAARFSAAQVMVLPGVGHMMMNEAPAATLAALRTVM